MSDLGRGARPLCRPVAYKGVIRVVHEASKLGFGGGITVLISD